MNDYPLSKEQIDFYQENGYIQLMNVLTEDELRQARNAIDGLIEKRQEYQSADDSTDYGKVFLQMVNMWRVDPEVRKYVLNPKVASIARRLAQVPAIRLWHDHALVKMPGDNKTTPWHQDIPYWPMEADGDGALSCWMALNDVNEENGCMHFVPKSHQLGRLEPINLTNPQDIFSLPEAKGVSMENAVPAPMPAGSCTFHDGRTFHFASENKTSEPRRAMVTIYMPDGTTYSGARHVVTDPLDMKPGQKFEGEHFPVLATQ